jgi:hypothetical protein
MFRTKRVRPSAKLLTARSSSGRTVLFPDLPGMSGAPCKLDCFWDNGNGSGNDDCYWDHECDPLEVPPNYPPEGSDCAYDPNAMAGPMTMRSRRAVYRAKIRAHRTTTASPAVAYLSPASRAMLQHANVSLH